MQDKNGSCASTGNGKDGHRAYDSSNLHNLAKAEHRRYDQGNSHLPRLNCRCALLQVHEEGRVQRTALSNSRWVDEEDEMGIWKIELPLRAETSRQCLMTNNAQNRAALSNNAYLWCHGAHITLLCDGEEGRGAAGKAV
ncbi:hypothetical protein KCU69_g57, partial [Aureobasidium melanogenum]